VTRLLTISRARGGRLDRTIKLDIRRVHDSAALAQTLLEAHQPTRVNDGNGLVLGPDRRSPLDVLKRPGMRNGRAMLSHIFSVLALRTAVRSG
jgi:hypothetical protein